MDASNTNTAYPKSAEAILLPIFAFLAILLLIVPFIWHWRLRNIGACSLILYINLANFFTFINAIIWPAENFDSWWNGAGLCDIEVKLRWPCVTGLACATLCITRNLANVLDVDRAEVMPTKASKRRKVAIDLAICFTIPVLQIALHYIIQVNRYNITVIGGCHESYDNSWPTIVIMYIWPPLFSLINCYYAGMSYPCQPSDILFSKAPKLTQRYSCSYLPSPQTPVQLLCRPRIIWIRLNNCPFHPPIRHVNHAHPILHPCLHILLLHKLEYRMATLRLECHSRPKPMVDHPTSSHTWNPNFR